MLVNSSYCNVSSSNVTVTVQNSTPIDSTAPQCKITSPADGARIGKSVKIYISSTDNVAVTKVELYIDGTLAGTSSSPTPVFTWSTRTVARGAHKIQAYAHDAAGNIGASALVTVYKSNNGHRPPTAVTSRA